jgi:hypothetical protein
MSKSDRTTIIVLDRSSGVKALTAAKQIAAKTGRAVTVRDPDGAEIDTLFPTKH